MLEPDLTGTSKIKVGSLFAGAGGICQGFKNANYNVVWANEIDKHACETYRLNHKSTLMIEKSIEDITQSEIKSLDKIDILTAGFPCQPFSLAGNKKGFNDPRGNLFFNFIDILKWSSPKAYMLENVKNIVGHDSGNTLKKIKDTLKKCGYSFIPFVLKASDYSKTPQARERVYIVGFKGECNISYFNALKEHIQNSESSLASLRFQVPKKVKSLHSISSFIESSSILESDVYNKNTPINEKVRSSVTEKNTFYQYRRYYVRENKSGLCPTLTANMGSGGHNVPIFLDGDFPRRLTPKECFNFQGFPKSFKLPKMMARSSLYKQAGNSVVVPVIESIAKELRKAMLS